MPQYFDDNAPMFGRRRAKDLKIYHTRKCIVGPDIISKYIWYMDSHYTKYKFIGPDGQLKKQLHERPYPSLTKAQTMFLERFDTPYSVNKHQRWTIMSIGRKSISSLQNRSIGLRVSIYRELPNITKNFYYGCPEWLVDSTYDHAIISEFHGSNDDNELHLKRRNVNFARIFRKDEVLPRKKKRRYYRRKYPILRLNGWMSNEEQDKIEFEQRSTHLVFKEQCFTPSIRVLNMDRMWNPRRTKTRTSMLSRTAEKKLKKKERKQKRREDMDRRRSQMEIRKRSTNGCKFLRKYEENSDRETVSLIVDTDTELSDCDGGCVQTRYKPALSDFEVYPRKQSRKSSKKKARGSVSPPDYQRWLLSSPSVDYVAVNDEETKETSSEMISRLLLPSFVVQLNEKEETFLANAKELLPDCKRLVGVLPETFLSNVDNISDDLRKLIPELVDCMYGYIFVTRCLSHEDTVSLRCIVNRNDSSMSEMDRRLPHKFTTCAPISRFIPCERFVPSTSYTQEMADNIACARLLAESGHMSEDTPSTSLDPSYCPICDSDGWDGFALQCGHFFCRECWTSHATHMLLSGIVPVTCPGYGCRKVLIVEHMLMLLSIPLCERYRKMLASKCMLRSNWVQCTNCVRALLFDSPSSQRYLAQCECGNVVCLRCKQNAHPPLQCEEARQYLSILASNGQSSSIFDDSRSVMVKRCPFCGSFCERIEGCNQMQCVCGESFCYACSKKWDGSSHYECTVDVFVVVEVLEFNTLGIYVLRRQLRHTSDGNFAQSIAMLVGLLRCFANRLSFLAKRITSLSANRATKPSKVIEVCDLVECTLFAYMNEVC
uniref:RBR-type E3 ubiquitin transferase n=1 Tax=Parascaris univalens TaxID=6257 RepID=A0A915BBZ2_PARUN